MADHVVVATHELTRTGAPMSLLHVLRWLVANTDLSYEVIAARPGDDGGALFEDFASLVPTRVAPELFTPDPSPLLPAGAVLYLNSVFAGGCLSHLPTPRPYVISRVPELSVPFDRWLPPDVRAALLAQADRFIAVSGSVQRMLHEEHGVPAERIVVVPGSVDLADLAVDVPVDRRALRRELGLPADALVVGASGTTDWRKGPDLFLRLAKELVTREGDRPIHFVWVGGEADGPDFWRVERARSGGSVAARVHFIGRRPDPHTYHRLMDVFTLTSREDPFPRVCMELAALEVPVVTFDNGGAVELVSSGCGFVVPYLDVAAMADRVLELLGDATLRARLGAVGRTTVRDRHTIETGGPATLEEIRRGLAHGGGA